MVEVKISDLGIQCYGITHDAMKARVSELRDGSRADLWLVEHPSVFTQGQAGRAEHILSTGLIPIVQSDRGGQVTYHGPGQVILYTLVPLKLFRLNVRQFISLLEKTVIKLLASHGINSGAHPKRPGVYVQNRKIASLGLRIRHGVCYHGVALNVSMNLSPFSRINPCGHEGLEVTQLSDLASGVSTKDVGINLAERLKKELIALASHGVAS